MDPDPATHHPVLHVSPAPFRVANAMIQPTMTLTPKTKPRRPVRRDEEKRREIGIRRMREVADQPIGLVGREWGMGWGGMAYRWFSIGCNAGGIPCGGRDHLYQVCDLACPAHADEHGWR